MHAFSCNFHHFSEKQSVNEYNDQQKQQSYDYSKTKNENFGDMICFSDHTSAVLHQKTVGLGNNMVTSEGVTVSAFTNMVATSGLTLNRILMLLK